MRRGGRGAKLLVSALVLAAVVLGWDDRGPLLGRHQRPQLANAVGRQAADPLDLGRLEVEGEQLIAPAPATPPPGDTAIAPPPETFTGPPARPTPPPAALRRAAFDGVTPEAGTWAVIIGINDYPGTDHDLRSAVADANDVNEALGDLGVPGSHRLLIRDGQATANTIRASIDWLDAHASADAVGVFFYAGHVRKLASSTEAIVGADGQLVQDTELASRLDGLKARQAWIGIAACYGGGFTEVLRPGRVLTAAAGPNDVAYENEGFGRSYLVEYMIRKAIIEGQARGTVQTSFSWAKAQLQRDYPDRVPVEYDDSTGAVDLRPPAAAQPSGSAPPPTTAPPSGGGASGGGGGGSQPPKDTCSSLTLGVVRCGSG